MTFKHTLVSHGDKHLRQKLSLSPHGNWLVSSHATNEPRLINLKTGETIPLRGQNFWFTHIAWHPNETEIIASTTAETVAWKIPKDSNEKVGIFRRWRGINEVYSGSHTHRQKLEYLPEFRTRLLFKKRHMVNLWCPQTSGLTETGGRSHNSKVITFCMAPDGSKIASLTADGTLHIWTLRDMDGGRQIENFCHTTPFDGMNLSWSANGKRLLLNFHGKCYIWDNDSTGPARRIRCNLGSNVIISPVGRLLLGATSDLTAIREDSSIVALYDITTGAYETLFSTQGLVENIMLSRDGKRLFLDALPYQYIESPSVALKKGMRQWCVLEFKHPIFEQGHIQRLTKTESLFAC